MGNVSLPTQEGSRYTWGAEYAAWLTENVFTTTGYLKDPVLISEYIKHLGDLTTLIRFETGQISLVAANIVLTGETSIQRQLAHADIVNLAAGSDLTDYPIYGSGYAATLTKIGILTKGTPAGIDDSNTCVLTIKNGAGSTVLTKTYDASTQPPTKDFEDLGTILIAAVAADDKLTLTIVQGTTANMPAFSIILE